MTNSGSWFNVEKLLKYESDLKLYLTKTSCNYLSRIDISDLVSKISANLKLSLKIVAGLSEIDGEKFGNMMHFRGS